jgi:hypothetical protein
LSGQEGNHRQGEHRDAGGAGKSFEIEGRIAQIKAQIERPPDYDREKPQERLAKLAGRRGDPRGRSNRGRGQGAQGSRDDAMQRRAQR